MIDPAHPPIVAMFLTKFDVHSGYDLKWFKSLDAEMYPSKGLEFKSLPSGLHAVESDTICFTQEKSVLDLTASAKPSFLYGMSVFRQNKVQQVSGANVDREKVKLFSLGILIDPEILESGAQNGSSNVSIGESTWKPKVYSACWNYKHKLSKLLDQFMKCGNEKAEKDFYSKFELFYDDYRSKSKKFSILNKKPKSVQRALADQLTAELSQPIQTQPSSNDTNNVHNTTTKTSPEFYANEMLNTDDFRADFSASFDGNNNDHMIDSLVPLYKSLGPLIYKIWKISLLRKKILIYTPHNPTNLPSITDVQETETNSEKPISIGDMAKFIYSISLISSVPKEIKTSLIKSGVKDLDKLDFITPIYNLCVNDITFMKTLNCGFIGSTTDQIILEKSALYNYALKLPISPAAQVSLNDLDSTPQVFKSGDLSKKAELASQRDFERFKIVYAKLFGTVDDDYSDFPTPDDTLTSEVTSESASVAATEETEVVSQQQETIINEETSHQQQQPTVETPASSTLQSRIGSTKSSNTARRQKIDQYNVTVEPVTLRELVCKGLTWWATAGESTSQYITEDKFQIELDTFDNDGLFLSSNTNNNSNISRVRTGSTSIGGPASSFKLTSFNSDAGVTTTASNVEVLIGLVGYFQKLTIRMFNIMIDIINNDLADISNEYNLRQGTGGVIASSTPTDDVSSSPSFADDSDDEERGLLSGSNAVASSENPKPLWIELHDMYEMGLDPYSDSDREFLVEFVKVWWNRDVKIGGFCGNLCCF
ncbi:unnamed protein product [Ambrosiozyma monospora]|uniref:Unnamed protein product n=1 Tax=Ambrosiozyma monospora TaxID=43982 RepID=A0ACB5T6N3_AMBMO|nr:unnamed protein product [Ambrosiozyma monospora]